MDLPSLWFVIIGVLWSGYFLLEGFDFGVGMLLPFLGRDDTERRVMINTIGPVWDGNEVWLLTAGGATFAAFPAWYASMFSGFYLPLLLILLALIVRVVSFEWRGKIDDDRWRARSDRALIVGSWVPAVLWGVAFGNIVRGIDLDSGFNHVGSLGDLLNPYALLGGVSTTLLFLTHGAVFLALKTDGEIRHRAGRLGSGAAVATTAATGTFALWTQLAYSVPWTWAATAVAGAGLAGLVAATRRRREGWAFLWSAVVILAVVVLLFGSLYPDVLPATDPANSLTVTNASSSPYTLRIMSWVALGLTPLVLLYQGWTYWVFRKRISTEEIPAATGLHL